MSKDKIKHKLLLRLCRIIGLFGFIAILLPGCTPKTQIVLMPDPGNKIGIIDVSTAGGTLTLNRAWESTENANEKGKPGKPKILTEGEVRRIFCEALAVEPAPPLSFIIYFKTNSAALSTSSLSQMARVFAAIKARKEADIVVSGHTDAAGTSEYNRNLSLRRARTVAYILADEGIDRRNIHVTYHGKANPLVPTPDGIAEARNRRVEITVR